MNSAYLITYFGTVIYFDELSSSLRHGTVGLVPDNVLLRRDGAEAFLYRKGLGTSVGEVIGDLDPNKFRLLAVDSSPSLLRVKTLGGVHIVLEWSGRYLSAEQDGSISLLHLQIGDRENFLELCQDDHNGLSFVTSHSWIRRSPRNIVRPRDILPQAGFMLLFGDVTVSLVDMLRLIRGPSATRPDIVLEITLCYDGWKIAHWRLYKPLAYLVGYGNEDIFSCATLAIDSLLSHGQWDEDIVFITDQRHAQFSTPLSTLSERLQVVTLAAHDTLDFALARYRIADIEMARQFQPLIYLDTDVICNAPLDTLTQSLCFSDDLHVLFEGNLLDAADYYGKTLFERDPGFATDEDRGFSTGILGFRNTSQVRQLFGMILSSAYNFASYANRRDFFVAFDQPFANYIVRRTAKFPKNLARWGRISAYVHEPDCSAGSRLGLVHFPGGVGNASPKFERMLSYLKAIGEADLPS